MRNSEALLLSILALTVIAAGCGSSQTNTPTSEPTSTILPTPSDALEAEGQRIFTDQGGCAACHAIEGVASAEVGPDLSNIGAEAADRKQPLSAREYLTESIKEPEAYVATHRPRGVPGLMTQAITQHLTDSEVEALVAFLLAQENPTDVGDLPPPPQQSVSPGVATLEIHEHSLLGPILTDTTGNSLYLFGADAENQSVCLDLCARVWPPLLTNGEPVAGPGVDASLIGVIERPDGSSQVTYNRWPLYYFIHDSGANSGLGHNIVDKWGLWLALSPDGNPAPTEDEEATKIE